MPDRLLRPRGTHMVGTALHWSHQAAFEATLVSVSQARSFVSNHLVDHGLLYLVEPVRLVTSELATNALVHAHTAFLVTLATSNHTVLLTVRDDSLSLPVRRTAQPMDSTGRGLNIVDEISLAWGITQDGTGSKTVWASFAIKERQEFDPRIPQPTRVDLTAKERSPQPRA